MKEKVSLTSLFPGSVGTNFFVLIFGIVLAVCAFSAQISDTPASLLAGFGSSMFLAGFLGLINVKVLSEEVHKTTIQPIEDAKLLAEIHTAGITGVTRNRNIAKIKLISSINNENEEIVIVGSSLKGLIGVGQNPVGDNMQVRNALINALKRGTKVKILMTNPEVAHHRATQEGRNQGDIEEEILKNLISIIMLKNEIKSDKLEIQLYKGTPTIFMVCTSNFMMINPYPYYSTAFGSFSFMIRGNSVMHKGYYESHYQNAWGDTNLSQAIEDNIVKAKFQVTEFIDGTNQHGENIIPTDAKKNELRDLLTKI